MLSAEIIAYSISEVATRYWDHGPNKRYEHVAKKLKKKYHIYTLAEL